MPVTMWTFVIGGAALAGFPLVTAGFWSKDEILADAWAEAAHSPVVLFVLVALSGSGGCNSGDVCDIRFSEFLNGTSEETQDSEWQCENGGVIVFTIAFFSDGFGVRSDAGDFEWEQTKCKEVDLETLALEQATLDRIEGGVREVAGVTVGTLSFRQTSDELGDLTVSCNLVLF